LLYSEQEDIQLSGILAICRYHQLRPPVVHKGVDPCSKDGWPLSGYMPFASSFLFSSLCVSCFVPDLGGQLLQMGKCLASKSWVNW
jgi:hypothetical protein